MRSLFALALLLCMSCGGSDQQSIDTSGLVGSWRGTTTITIGTRSAVTPNTVIPVTGNGTELSIGNFCNDASGPSATATSSTQFTVHPKGCAGVSGTINSVACSSIVISIASGTGSVANGTLTVSGLGTVAGCNQSLSYSLSFVGTK